MASSGKKGKKSKGKTLALNDFLQETPGTVPTVPLRKSTSNWADEVEDVYDSYDTRAKSNVVLPTAPKAARGLDDFSDKIPQQPPYSAYLSNLPYDVSEEEIAEFFGNLKIAHMRIPKDERPGEIPKLKGFGYIEFEDRESLIGALAMPDCSLKSRRIRIEVSTNSENDRRRGRMDMGRDRADRPEFTGDWRSGPRADPVESDRRGGGGGFSRERDREAPMERSTGGWRDSTDRPSFREPNKDRQFSREYDRGNDRDDRRGFGSRRNDRDDRNGSFTRAGMRDDLDKAEPRSRTKLVLAPRTKPLETPLPENDTPKPAPLPAASIFGSAKPVDTSARERQIEERLAKQSEKQSESVPEMRREIRRDDSRGREFVRKSPSRRNSPDRRSPRRYSPANVSPSYRKRSVDRKRSPNKRRSPDRRRSPDMRRSPDTRSLDKRRSPDRRSPERRYSPDRRRSPVRRRSPDGRRISNRPRSPNTWESVERSRSAERNRSVDSRSPDRSMDRRSPTPERRKLTPSRKSPELNKRGSPEPKIKGRRSDEKERKGKNDKSLPKEKTRREEKHREPDREMPKFKEPEPPNFAASNKYAFLQTEDSD